MSQRVGISDLMRRNGMPRDGFGWLCFLCPPFCCCLLAEELPLPLLATNHDNKFQFYLVSEAAKHPCHRHRQRKKKGLGVWRGIFLQPNKGNRSASSAGQKKRVCVSTTWFNGAQFYDFLFYTHSTFQLHSGRQLNK